MGLRLSNRQLRLLTELVLEAEKAEPNIEWEAMLDRLVEMARHRGLTLTMSTQRKDPNDLHGLALRVEAERPKRSSASPTPPDIKTRSRRLVVAHPLFRDEPKSGSDAA